MTPLRVQIEYDKGFENHVDTVTEVVDDISNLDLIENYWFFWQEYSEKFNIQVQLGLIVDDKREAKEKNRRDT